MHILHKPRFYFFCALKDRKRSTAGKSFSFSDNGVDTLRRRNGRLNDRLGVDGTEVVGAEDIGE